MQLPLFPLSTIVMPGGLLPLRLFEPRYIDMVKECFKTSTGFGVCLIKRGHEAGTPAEPYPVGTLVSLIDFDQGRDGLLQITVQGETEFIVHRYAANDEGLILGDIELLAPCADIEMTSNYAMLSSKLAIMLDYVESNIQFPEKHLDDTNWVCHRLMELLPLSAPMKYELLQMRTNHERMDFLVSLKIEFTEHSRQF